jgi:hypothetical protein
VVRFGIGAVTLALVIAAAQAGAARSTSVVETRARTVPCSESIAGTRFPYLGSSNPRERDRLVLGVVSAPRAFLRQIVRGNGIPGWPYFFKSGLVIRSDANEVIVSVPRAWRDRAAIAWGNGGNGAFDTLRFAGCRSFRTQGVAYAGGFFLRSAPACLPLTFRVRQRSATVRFGLGRRCS